MADGERIHVIQSARIECIVIEPFDEGVEHLVCLSWEAQTGARWAELLARLRTSGRAMPIKDSLIAATALVHRLTIATRNEKDFTNAGVKIFNPFE